MLTPAHLNFLITLLHLHRLQFVLLLLLQTHFFGFTNSIQLDIHLPLVANKSSCIYNLAKDTNEKLNVWSLSRHTYEQIHFSNFYKKQGNVNNNNNTISTLTGNATTHMQIPHVTLFLTDYSIEDEEGEEEQEEHEKPRSRTSRRTGDYGSGQEGNKKQNNIVKNTIFNQFIARVNDAICQSFQQRQTTSLLPTNYHHINTKIQQPILSSPYAMYRISLNHQLHTLSNTIVNYTQTFVKQNQSIPKWVDDIIDQKVKLKKIQYIKKYGSPNVYDEFDPHVTVGYDDYQHYNNDRKKKNDVLDSERKMILDHMGWEQCSGWIDEVRIGFVGDYGTVIGDPLATIDFKSCSEKNRRRRRFFVHHVSSIE